MKKSENTEKTSFLAKIIIFIWLLKYPACILILLGAWAFVLFHQHGDVDYYVVFGVPGLVLGLLSVFFAAMFKKWRQFWMWVLVLTFLGLFGMFLFDNLPKFFKAPEKTYISIFGIIPIPYSGYLLIFFFVAYFLAMLAGIFIAIFKNHGRWKTDEIFPDEMNDENKNE